MADSIAKMLLIDAVNANVDNLYASEPFANGIRIMSPDYLVPTFAPPYYGDAVNLRFWELLGLDIGAYWQIPPKPQYLTWQQGYKYIYNHTRRTFDAYDASGSRFVHRVGIKSMADMGIDFTIYKSHEFEIIIESGALSGVFTFIFPTESSKKYWDSISQDLYKTGVQNIYLPDRVRPYKDSDWDNPHIELIHIGDIINTYLVTKEYDRNTTGKVYDLDALNYNRDIDFPKNCPVNYVYNCERFNEGLAKKTEKRMRLTRLTWDILLAMLAFGLYPALMPIVMPNETINNRPVYEPWVIWGFLKFLYNKRTDDNEDDFEIPVFDLSPRT